MERAVDLAVQNVQEGGQPFGAVLVKDKESLAEGVNTLHKVFDISGHAELQAIRKAQEMLQTNDLSDCTMYASGEPCVMCLTAMYFTGIEKIYYGTSLKEAVEQGFEPTEVMTDNDLKRLKDSMVYLPLREMVVKPVTLWKSGMK